ncbi:hypothetical protein [Bradyrhizobium sp. ARR65]|uniref:hypothetical protein n=1 Tax=Bradyrhizobium sp. ARR65 TaxID=1040989 RepID=UPI000463C3FB|nr:hypothetical protein [Bradyrhizobium sp. ARR65]
MHGPGNSIIARHVDTAGERLSRKIEIYRFPDVNQHGRYVVDHRMPLNSGRDSPPYLCVTAEDGHKASPICVLPG